MTITTREDNKGISNPKIDSHLGIIGGTGLKREILLGGIIGSGDTEIFTSNDIKKIYGVQIIATEDDYNISEGFADFIKGTQSCFFYNDDISDNGWYFNNNYSIRISTDLNGTASLISDNQISLSVLSGVTRRINVNFIFIGV